MDNILKNAFTENSVPVVFAANDGFAPVFAACLQSLMEHRDECTNYDLILLYTCLNCENRETLSGMTEDIPNVSLRFFDVSPLLAGYRLKANSHISEETYYRFLIQEILPGYDKVLYIDCDTIVNADVAELYRTDVTGYMLAAVRDADFLGQIGGAKPGTVRYCREAFPMRDPNRYFQAGVLLLNEQEMRKAFSTEQWLKFASTPYMYNDQDVLNLNCEGRVKYLDMAWNVLTDSGHERISGVISYAPKAVREEYWAARERPKIIHYAGRVKPWQDESEDFADFFWESLQKTPYYESMRERLAILERERAAAASNAVHLPGRLKTAGTKMLRFAADILFPLGTRRREQLKRHINIYKKF